MEYGIVYRSIEQRDTFVNMMKVFCEGNLLVINNAKIVTNNGNVMRLIPFFDIKIATCGTQLDKYFMLEDTYGMKEALNTLEMCKR